MPDYRFVDMRTDDTLPAALENRSRIGIDTEFVREKTYFAELCLVQISAGRDIFCADPLGLDSEDPQARAMWQSILAPSWVLHSGRQDLEVIYQAVDRLPGDIFDTQIAAGLLGYQPQIGYGNLVQDLFDIALAKSHTRADWSRRPLPDAYVEYAAEDVEYLLPAYEILSERLELKDRLEWALEDSRDLLDVSLYRTDVSQAVDRLKGAKNLRGPARSAAAALAMWREEEAIRRNRPRQWIMRDAVLLEIAAARPGSGRQLAAVPGLAERTATRNGDRLLEVLKAAAERQSDYVPPARPDERQKALLKKMQGLVADVAKGLGLAGELIAPRKDLSAAIQGSRDVRIFRGWRRDCVGERLLELLNAA